MARGQRQRRRVLQEQLPDYSAWLEEPRTDTRFLAALVAGLATADADERERLLNERIPLELVEQGLETYTSPEGVTVRIVEVPRGRTQPGKEREAEEWLRQRGYKGPANEKRSGNGSKAIATFLQAQMQRGVAIPHELFDFRLRWLARAK